MQKYDKKFGPLSEGDLNPPDKREFKNYRMKAETGYLGSKFQKDQPKSFTWFVNVQTPLWRFQVKIPGFTNFGLKSVTVFDDKNEKVFEATAFTFFKTTRWHMPKEILQVGKKYKFTMKPWTLQKH